MARTLEQDKRASEVLKVLEFVQSFVAEDRRRGKSEPGATDGPVDMLVYRGLLDCLAFDAWSDEGVRELVRVLVTFASDAELGEMLKVARSERDWTHRYWSECETGAGKPKGVWKPKRKPSARARGSKSRIVARAA